MAAHFVGQYSKLREVLKISIKQFKSHHEPNSVAALFRLQGKPLRSLAMMPCPVSNPNSEQKLVQSSKRLRMLTKTKEKIACEDCSKQSICNFKFEPPKSNPKNNDKFKMVKGLECDARISDILYILEGMNTLYEIDLVKQNKENDI